MKALVCSTPGAFEYKDLPAPVLQPGHAILKIKRIGICGTDLHAYQGTQPYFTYPRILGHELAADLVDADGLSGFVPGEALTFIPYFSCGKCIACRNGKPNCCATIQVCGVHVDGGMADYLSVPEDTLVKSEGLSYDELALVEPLAIGAHGIRRAEVMKDEFVLVVGAGPIGLGTMEFARIAGARVIAMDFNETRLEFCKNTMNVAYTINPSAEDAIKRLAEITNGDMPTVVIDATGNRKAINNGLQYLAHGGRYVLIGLQREEFCFSHPEFHKREATLMSSRNATRQDFEHVIHTIKAGVIRPLPYITHRVQFDEVKEVFNEWLNPSAGVIKAMVEKD
ncbi:zinc-binding alcohol dehydrogenase family protein [Agriterribacter sp.]|uniref:zinc-binding alcohol dehydrogenase family protein n=1 Tax=Agriterribacter sp. TaxID=2821509 RepID=UPI002C13DA2F|nr:zinc-binding alcohol dehydrogenase family protein [Agriterribacter sp.]HRO44796.1 zinc-binding alcohol dehydrogenase family protein [Agriterribacter sp.]HRQ18119.1 zinc-binding alcohol dehydrogenase family protein [Agriterribacter sp.]